MNRCCFLTLFVLLYLPSPTPAPVPRCSPFIIINKLAEFNNLMSDSNPYFPMPPCEYGSWQNAIAKGDLRSVFVLAEPQKIPLHNFYEFVWFWKTGLPRFLRFVTGRQKFITDQNILREGYSHYTPNVRTRQLGENTLRRPEIIDNKRTYKSVILDKIGELLTKGPDRSPKPYTPQGPLPGRRARPGKKSARTSRPRARPGSTRTRQQTVSSSSSKFVPSRSVQGQWSPILNPSQRY